MQCKTEIQFLCVAILTKICLAMLSAVVPGFFIGIATLCGKGSGVRYIGLSELSHRLLSVNHVGDTNILNISWISQNGPNY